MNKGVEKSRVLIVAPPAEAESLHSYLQTEEFIVETLSDFEALVGRALSGYLSLMIIDDFPRGAGEVSGIELLRRVRQYSLLPVIILSDSLNDAQRVMVLELGADDYLHKPYHPQELIARIRAILRRSNAGISAFQHLLRVGNLELDGLRRKVRRGDEEIPLTTAEFDLLEMLLRHAGHAVTREDIARLILGRPLNQNDRSIDMHISNLRRKLERGQNCDGRIKAIRGIGYSFTIS